MAKGSFVTFGLLLSVTTVSFLILTNSYVSATDSADASVNVSAACTMTGSGNNSHTATITPGTAFTGNIGTTNIVASCNDPNGYSVYAIGYSGNPSTLGNTDLINTNATIATRAYDASYTTSSYWSMKLTAGQGTDAATIVTTPTDYSTYVAVPSDYAKVATKTSATSASPTTAFSTTYGVYTTAIQAAGEYVGKVKYVLVHPNTAPKPVAPLAEDDCPANSICYAPNASDIEGSMDSISDTKITKSPTAGVQKQTYRGTSSTPRYITSGLDATLVVQNYYRSGYGFAGWSPDFNATSSSTIYGPDETITVGDVSNHGMILYPVWVASTGNLQNWNGCNNLTKANYDSTTGKINATLSSVTALTDQRDGNVYAVARLADDNCWMMENLRLDSDVTINNTNTNNPISSFASLPVSEDVWPGATTAGYNQPHFNSNNTHIGGTNSTGEALVSSYNAEGKTAQWYGYGNYYNWYSATAGHGSTSKKGGDTDGDICPAGWRLPIGSSSSSSVSKSFAYLDISMGGLGTDANSGTQPTGEARMRIWRSFPTNFINSGLWWGSHARYGVDKDNMYWTSTATLNSEMAYSFQMYLNGEFRLDYTVYRSSGYTVRCVLK